MGRGFFEEHFGESPSLGGTDQHSVPGLCRSNGTYTSWRLLRFLNISSGAEEYYLKALGFDSVLFLNVQQYISFLCLCINPHVCEYPASQCERDSVRAVLPCRRVRIRSSAHVHARSRQKCSVSHLCGCAQCSND